MATERPLTPDLPVTPKTFQLEVQLAGSGPTSGASAPLAGYHWPAAGPETRRPVVVVHGFAEHARRHGELASALSMAGHPVWALDLPGHGESPGPRAVVAGYDDAVAAVGALVERAGREASDGEPVLFGHSMGGAIALRYATERAAQLAGLVLSSPFLIDANPRAAWLLKLVDVLAGLTPRLPVTKVDAGAISRDPVEVARYLDDPLVHTAGVPAVSGQTLTVEGAASLARASRLAVPTLVLHGSADTVAGVAGSRRLVADAPAGVVQLEEIEGGYHELFHDDPASGVPQRATTAVLGFIADL